jgi:hypothetical protein
MRYTLRSYYQDGVDCKAVHLTLSQVMSDIKIFKHMIDKWEIIPELEKD